MAHRFVPVPFYNSVMKIFFAALPFLLSVPGNLQAAASPRISVSRAKLPSSSVTAAAIRPGFQSFTQPRAPGSDLGGLGSSLTPVLDAAASPAGAEGDSTNGRRIADLLEGSRSVSEEAVWTEAVSGPLVAAPSGLTPAGSDSREPETGPEAPKPEKKDSEAPSKWSRAGDALAILLIVAGGVAGWAMIAYMFSQVGSVTFDPSAMDPFGPGGF